MINKKVTFEINKIITDLENKGKIPIQKDKKSLTLICREVFKFGCNWNKLNSRV